jgi:alpha-L-fucosidase
VLWPVLPKSLRTFRVPQGKLYDFATPEYAQERSATEHKWEAVRGIGPSFGNNRNETDADMPSADELIGTLVDVVSKNGNLLLGVGPEPNGDIPQMQQRRLREIGRWLSVNGEAIFETRPWTRAEGTTANGLQVRFTQRDGAIYAIVLGALDAGPLVIKDVAPPANVSVHMLGVDKTLAWEQAGPDLKIEVPQAGNMSAATAFRLE